jgi:hypothetical protein
MAGNGNFSGFRLKESLVELNMHRWQEASMYPDVSISSLSGLFMFEPEYLNSVRNGAPSYLGLDIFEALGHQDRIIEREEYLKDLITQHYNKNDSIMQDAIKLLDEEFKDIIIKPDNAADASPMTKVCAI